jgi:hypothetical protein
MAASVVEPFNADETIVRFHISGYEGPNAGGQEAYPIEGRTLDKDGLEVFVWIYADANQRLLELEILRVSPGPLISPVWSALELY